MFLFLVPLVGRVIPWFPSMTPELSVKNVFSALWSYSTASSLFSMIKKTEIRASLSVDSQMSHLVETCTCAHLASWRSISDVEFSFPAISHNP